MANMVAASEEMKKIAFIWRSKLSTTRNGNEGAVVAKYLSETGTLMAKKMSLYENEMKNEEINGNNQHEVKTWQQHRAAALLQQRRASTSRRARCASWQQQHQRGSAL